METWIRLSILKKTISFHIWRNWDRQPDMKITSFADVKTALTKRMEYFKKAGCCVSDHGLEYVAYADVTEDEVEAVFAKKMAGQELSREEIGKYKMGVLCILAKSTIV